MTDGELLPFPGQSTRLSYAPPHDDEGALADEAIAALDALGALFAPLAIELWLACRDAARTRLGVTPHGKHRLLVSALPDGVELVHTLADPRIERVPALSATVTRGWIGAALAERCPEGSTAWMALRVGVVRARLPDPARFGRRASLALDGVSAIPIERDGGGAWVAGPRIGQPAGAAPFRCAIYHEADGTLVLHLDVGWSLWTEPGSIGATLFGRTLDGLAARGWRGDSTRTHRPANR